MTGAPSTPHPIDPVSERLGALGADVQGIRERLTRIEATMDTLATKAELRAWASVIVVLLGTVLTVVVRQHGGG
jgi:hypothetical protein